MYALEYEYAAPLETFLFWFFFILIDLCNDLVVH